MEINKKYFLAFEGKIKEKPIIINHWKSVICTNKEGHKIIEKVQSLLRSREVLQQNLPGKQQGEKLCQHTAYIQVHCRFEVGGYWIGWN